MIVTEGVHKTHSYRVGYTISDFFSKGDQPCVYPEVGKLLRRKGSDTRNKKREIRGFEVDVLLCHFVSYT